MSFQKENETKGPGRLLTAQKIQNLQKIRPDPMLSSVLAQTRATVRVSIDQDNATVGLFDAEGDRFGTISELEKLLGFRKFILDLRKKTVVDQVMDPIRNHLYNIGKNSGIDEPAIIQSGVLAYVKEIETFVDNLKENFEFISGIYRTAETPFQRDLFDISGHWIRAIAQILLSLLEQVIRGKDVKGKLSDLLLSAYVPKWAFDKLARTEVAYLQTLDPCKIFYPKDNRKGISLTVREIANNDFIQNGLIRYLLQNSRYQVELFRNEALLKAAFKLKADETISFVSESDTLGVSLRGEKVILTPAKFDEDWILTNRETKLNQFVSNPSFANPKAALKTLLEMGLAFQTGDFRTADQVGNWWSVLYPDLDFVKGVNAKRNYFAVVKESKDNDPLTQVYSFNNLRKALFKDLIPILLQVKGSSAIAKEMQSLYSRSMPEVAFQYPRKEVKNDDGSIKEPAIPQRDGYKRPLDCHWDDTPLVVRLLTQKVDGVREMDECNHYAELLRIDKGSLKKEAKPNRQAKLSSLTRAGDKLLTSMARNSRTEYLIDPVRDWLQGFTSRAFQAIAANLVDAQFDVFFDRNEDVPDPITDDKSVDDDNDGY